MHPDDNRITDEDFVRLLTTYHNRIQYYVCSLIPNRSHAEDVMQDVSMALWEKRDQYDPDRNFFAWMRSFARVQVLSYYRQQSRVPCQLSELAVERLLSRIDDHQQHVDDRITALRTCVEKLPEEHQRLLSQFYDTPDDVPQLAISMNVQPGTIYVKVHRIRKSLLECVQRQLSRLKVLA
ncbi:sigma-70 family RNA polymerase sigma factor [Bremerella sp. JC770]|uniref:sigma-70 family RNA polymerase sigma factor n=1 Tax=Bremerella sp. JC770 TaxID=3232137 RepID=UPI00345747B9